MTDNIFKRLDDWWLRNSFPTFEWSRYFYVQAIEGDIMWLIDVEFDEDGAIPKGIYTAFKYVRDNIEEGDVIYINFYDSKAELEIEKNIFEEKHPFDEWFDEQIEEHNRKLNQIYHDKKRGQYGEDIN